MSARTSILDREKSDSAVGGQTQRGAGSGKSDGTSALVHEYKIDDRHERLDWETFYD